MTENGILLGNVNSCLVCLLSSKHGQNWGVCFIIDRLRKIPNACVFWPNIGFSFYDGMLKFLGSFTDYLMRCYV